MKRYDDTVLSAESCIKIVIFFCNKINNMQQSRLSHQSSQINYNLPKREEWSIIYNHRAQELQRAKSVQKVMLQQKKDNFKRQLDQQINSKNSIGQASKDEDKKYYEIICKKEQQMKEKEQKDKFDKFIRQKKLEEQNLKLYELSQGKKPNEKGKIYNIEIGLKSQLQKKQRAQTIRKDVIETLDRQRYEKQQQLKKKHNQDLVQLQRNQEYQQKFYSNRNPNKKYEQNQNVYNYYRDLFNKKMRKDKQLEHKFVDEVIDKNNEQAIKRRQREQQQKQRKNIQMKDTLEKQIQLINYRRREDNKTNPEQASYSFINNIFRQKKPAYDKREYSLFLDRQAQEQKHNKVQLKYMNQQQYKLNSNQLNKAVSGNYTFDNYYDRSMGTVGDRLHLSQTNPLHGDDAELVKNKLENLRSRKNKSMLQSQNDIESYIS